VSDLFDKGSFFSDEQVSSTMFYDRWDYTGTSIFLRLTYMCSSTFDCQIVVSNIEP
jgi:hypothetical protein